MKKTLFMLLLFVGGITVSMAQNVQEVVYLKNGSVVRGVVIEQVPGGALKIQTADGSIFAYQMSEVTKITKENTKSNFKNGNSLSLNNNSGNETGYNGFFDLGYTIGTGDYGVDRIELSTSHGYQFNPHLYAGAGIGVNYYTDAEVIGLPIFAHVRGNMLNNSISPYIDFRIGYSPLKDVQGLYMAPSVGCKIHLFNVSFGYVMQEVKYEYYRDDSGSENCGGFSLKVGFEF